MQKTWGFYGRSVELAEISRILESGKWFFCAISGRRRIGKTRLIQEAVKRLNPTSSLRIPILYFQVPDSDERGVVQTFEDALEDNGISTQDSRKFSTFQGMSIFIGAWSRQGGVVAIDEFQYFNRAPLAPFASFLQEEIDRNRDSGRGGLFVLGSIHTEMTAILEDRSSPLFNRVTHRIQIGHWDFQTLFEMFQAHEISDPLHQLFLWSLFEGVPKFYRDAFEQGVLIPAEDHRQTTIRRLFFEGSSPLKDEADNWFLRELRGRYDSVLKLMARLGPCTHGTLMNEYARAGEGGEKQLGGYLQILIEKYRMVEKLAPVFSGRSSRKARYVIADNFLSSWLHALARNVQMARVQPLERPVARADQALMVQEGYAFEKMIRLLTEECSRKGVGDFHLTDMVRGYWNKADGSDIEIDLVAMNDEDRVVRLGSCKRSELQHHTASIGKFRLHADKFLKTAEGGKFRGWTVEYALYSPKFEAENRRSLESLGYICKDLIDFRKMLHP
ncbi:MAG: ATP-binding protein [Rhodospirillales bacterium]|nr:MAG: ATP-binding protein [Rhodospirillales bacterium]